MEFSMEPKQVKDITSILLAICGCVLGLLANFEQWVSLLNL